MPAVLPGAEGVPQRAVPCPLRGVDQECGVSLLPARGLPGWRSLAPAATPVPRKAWWGGEGGEPKTLQLLPHERWAW